jgi:hypothetical protein
LNDDFTDHKQKKTHFEIVDEIFSEMRTNQTTMFDVNVKANQTTMFDVNVNGNSRSFLPVDRFSNEVRLLTVTTLELSVLRAFPAYLIRPRETAKMDRPQLRTVKQTRSKYKHSEDAPTDETI